jgi:hypothetical protein
MKDYDWRHLRLVWFVKQIMQVLWIYDLGFMFFD